MNFLDGDSRRRPLFARRPAVSARLSARRKRAAVAGVRPEDCRVTAPSEGKIVGEVYATELMGDHALVTCRVAATRRSTVKADKVFGRRDGEAIGVDFAEDVIHLFDKTTGDRIR